MKKIDLHMHTTYSDGAHSLQELLHASHEKGLDTISITDHNTVDAYFELEQNNYSHLFRGKIIKGVEIYSYYSGKTIEFLVYDYDLKKMKEFLEKHYNKDWNTHRIHTVLNKQKAVAKQKGLTFDENFTITKNMGECALFFAHLMTFEENKKAFSEEVVSGKKSFFRTEVCNTNSDFYVDYEQFYIKPNELITFVNKTGGKIFLAHLYEYHLENPTELLDYVKNLGVTGIECYYPTFTKTQCEFLLDYTSKNNLLASGGSDFHGGARPNELSLVNSQIELNLKRFDWTNLAVDVNKKNNGKYNVSTLTLTKTTPVTTLTVNTIILTSETHAVIFDPSVPLKEITEHIENKTVAAIVLTHAHWDHVLTLKECLETFNCPLYLHEKGVKKLTDAHLNCADTHELNLTFELPKNTRFKFLKEQNGLLKIADITLNYYYTPGHSDDSLSFIIENNLICGDSVRLNKLARTNLPTSSEIELQHSHTFYKTLNADMMVYNGHDKPSLLKNYFLWQEKK